MSRVPLVRNKTVGAAAPTGTATLIVAANKHRYQLHIKNNHATVVMYVGNSSSVSTATGYPLAAAGGEIVDIDSTDAWWGIMASAVTGDARYIEVA